MHWEGALGFGKFFIAILLLGSTAFGFGIRSDGVWVHLQRCVLHVVGQWRIFGG